MNKLVSLYEKNEQKMKEDRNEMEATLKSDIQRILHERTTEENRLIEVIKSKDSSISQLDSEKQELIISNEK